MNGFKIEEIKVTVNGETRIFDLEEFPGKGIEPRAYLRDSTRYYDLHVFESGLPKADKVERYGFLEQDKWTK